MSLLRSQCYSRWPNTDWKNRQRQELDTKEHCLRLRSEMHSGKRCKLYRYIVKASSWNGRSLKCWKTKCLFFFTDELLSLNLERVNILPDMKVVEFKDNIHGSYISWTFDTMLSRLHVWYDVDCSIKHSGSFLNHTVFVSFVLLTRQLTWLSSWLPLQTPNLMCPPLVPPSLTTCWP